MDTRERVDALERDFEQITQQLAAINICLDSLAKSLPPPPPTSISNTDTTMENGVQGTGSRVKPAPPSDFDGDRDKGHVFLNSCELYLRLSLPTVSLMSRPRFIGHLRT